MVKARKRPAVSVALATYNGERFIREQLESIKRQTILPTEIVISDDNSKDQTLAIVSEVLSPEWSSKAGVTLTVLRNTRALGPGPNFEQAIMACSGDFIVLADQDDLWHDNKVEVLLKAFEEHPQALLIHSDADLVDASGRSLGMTLSHGIDFAVWEREQLASGHSLPAFIKRNLATGATIMFKRELAEFAFPLPQGDLHDGRLAIVASLLDAVRFVPEPLIDYRQHDNNQIGGKRPGLVDSVVALLKSWRDMAAVLASRNEELESLLEKLGTRVPPANVAIARARIAHNEWRMSLPASRVFRIWPVLWGVIQGRYRRYGRQPHDVLRDLVMPPREVLLGFFRALARNSEK